MKLKVMTKRQLLLEREDATSVTLPGREGELTVLPGHDLLVTELVPGQLSFRAGMDVEQHHYRVGLGVAEVTQGSVMVFVAHAMPIDG